MIVTVTALLTAVVLSELAFDARDTAYWRRWLGRFGYTWRRVLLAVVPAALALALRQVAPEKVGVAEQLMVGVATGVTATALLRADVRRVHTSIRHTPGPESAQVASALSWVYRQTCQRLDAHAYQRIVAFMTSLKNSSADHPLRLLLTAEEIEGVVSQEMRSVQGVKNRKELQERLDCLRQHMDVLQDPMADARDRRRASIALSESITEEMATRRWNRPPAHNRPKECR